jgi:hypothetical protein
MYFEFDDVRRIHQPYTDPVTRGKSLIILFTHQILTYISAYLEATNIQLPIFELEERNVCYVHQYFLRK